MQQPDLLGKITSPEMVEGVTSCISMILQEGYDAVCLIPLKVCVPARDVLLSRLARLPEEDKQKALTSIEMFESDPCEFLGTIISHTRQLLEEYGLGKLAVHREKFDESMMRIRSAFNFDTSWVLGEPIEFYLITGMQLNKQSSQWQPLGLGDYLMLRIGLTIGLNKLLRQFDEEGEMPDELHQWVTAFFEEGVAQVFHNGKPENVVLH